MFKLQIHPLQTHADELYTASPINMPILTNNPDAVTKSRARHNANGQCVCQSTTGAPLIFFKRIDQVTVVSVELCDLHDTGSPSVTIAANAGYKQALQ